MSCKLPHIVFFGRLQTRMRYWPFAQCDVINESLSGVQYSLAKERENTIPMSCIAILCGLDSDPSLFVASLGKRYSSHYCEQVRERQGRFLQRNGEQR